MPPKAPPRRGAASGTASTRASSTAANPNPQSQSQPTQSTASPAGGSARPPVQRLQTLKKRAPSASIGPSGAGAARATPGPAGAGAGAAGPGGDPPKPTLKYKPRAVGRRSKEEREAIEKLEAQRHRERLAEAAAIQRGRGGPAGGRGGAAGRGGRGGAFGGAAGPLGSGFGGAGGARRGRGGRFGGDSRQSSVRSRSIIDLGNGAGRGGEDVSSDESDNEVRVCIDRINLESDEEGDVGAAEGKKGKAAVKYADARGGEKGLRPVRVERHEHAERVVSVNMESSSSKSAELREKAKAKAGTAAGDDALFVPAEQEQQQPAESRVKEEPTDDGDQVMTEVAPHDEAEAGRDDGFLPKQKVKVRRKLSREPTTPPEPVEDEVDAPAGEAGVAPVLADPKSLLRTKEDLEEYERHEKDLELIRELLRHEEKKPSKELPEGEEGEPSAATADADADTTVDTTTADGEKEKPAEDEEAEEDDKLAGHLFLVQFPPLTPNLIVPSNEDNAPEQPETTTTNGNSTEPSTQAPTDTPVKREDEAEIIDDAKEQPDAQPASQVVTATDWQLRAGRVGKLNVHASGRVSMNWGGISFDLDRATAVGFLQEALIVSTPPGTTEEIPEDEKKVWAMGQLSGKFTVTPNWEAML